MPDPITIRPFRLGDEEGLLAGHNRTFQPPRSLAHWQWKFRDNPANVVHTMVAAHEQHGIVGAYVTIPVRFLVEGKQRIAGQCVDLYVLPEYRRHGARPGLFVNLALAHYEAWGGRGADQNAFHFGWPIATWRIGQKYLRYEIVRDWDFLFCAVPAAGFRPRPRTDAVEVRSVQRFDADTDALWNGFAPSVQQLAVIRDAKYLNWRFADAHDAKYELFECRDRQSNALRGVMVLRHSDFLFPNTCFIVDWVVPVNDGDATVALLAMAEQRATALHASTLATLFQHRDPRFVPFQKLGFLVYGSEYFQVVIPFAEQETHFFREHWYHTLGDSDLV